MFLTKEDLDERLDSPENLCNIVKLHNGGRPVGSKNKTVEEKAAIGALASVIGTGDAAKVLEMDPAYVSRLKNGKSHQNYPADPHVVEGIKEKKETLASAALLRIEMSLGLITEADLVDAKLKDKLAVVRDLSSAVKNLSPEPKGPMIAAGTVIVYDPGTKKIADYEVIEVSPA